MAYIRKDARKLIQDATLSLMDEMPFHRIKVADICRRAGINRNSYYNHYYEQTEVVADVSNNLVKGFWDAFESADQTSDDGTGAMVEAYRYIQEQSQTFRIIMASEVSSIMRDSLGEHLTKTFEEWSSPFIPDGVPTDLFVFFYVSGSYGLIERWVLDGCVLPPEDVVSTLMHIMVHSVQGDA